LLSADSSGFFFQAEDGIRDRTVTGVQTCALPILRNILDQQSATSRHSAQESIQVRQVPPAKSSWKPMHGHAGIGRSWLTRAGSRSEERRVGKEGRGRRGGEDWKVRKCNEGERAAG